MATAVVESVDSRVTELLRLANLGLKPLERGLVTHKPIEHTYVPVSTLPPAVREHFRFGIDYVRKVEMAPRQVRTAITPAGQNMVYETPGARYSLEVKSVLSELREIREKRMLNRGQYVESLEDYIPFLELLRAECFMAHSRDYEMWINEGCKKGKIETDLSALNSVAQEQVKRGDITSGSASDAVNRLFWLGKGFSALVGQEPLAA